jgi:hypothetical protein
LTSLLIVLGLWLACQPLQAGFPELIRRVPGQSNAIMLIDAERLFASPIAQHEGWKKKQTAEFSQRPLAVPPQAAKVVRAAQVDLQEFTSPWAVTLIEAAAAPSLESIATREKGYVDKVAGSKAAWSPRGAYVVSVAPTAVGVLSPPNRQFLSTWLKQSSGKIPDYLLHASQSMAETDAQLLLALDLEDALDPQRVRAALAQSPAGAAAKGDPQALAAVLSSLRGVKFEVVFKDKAWGRLRLEFGSDPASLLSIAKPLVIETLDRAGASLDDIQQWPATQKGNVISLHGELSASGLLRLGSLFELPSIELDPSEEPVVADKPQLYATQNHFKAVGRLLDDLLDQKRDAKTQGQLALWVDQYAKRVDRLPLVNVDKDMQKYSAEVAEDLREIALTLKGSGIRSGVRTANTYDASGSGGYYGNYDGYYGNRVVDSERRAIRAQERGSSAMSTAQIGNKIRGDTSRIRQAMTERYKVEF